MVVNVIATVLTPWPCRCLLGFMQGGFIPDVILYLSYFYTKKERKFASRGSDMNSNSNVILLVPVRLAWFWVSNYMAEIVGAFIATGLLKLRGVNGKAGWRYLFLIEGGLTLGIGIASFFMMPPSPTQTKAWFRPKGWFTERYVTFYPLSIAPADDIDAARRPSWLTACCATTPPSRTCTTGRVSPSG